MTAADYLADVKRARQIEDLPEIEQDAAILALMHRYPVQRRQWIGRLVQLMPEAVAQALDALDESAYRDAIAGVDDFYARADERYAVYRSAAAEADQAAGYIQVLAAIAGTTVDELAEAVQ